MGDAGDLSDATFVTTVTEPSLPNSQILKRSGLQVIITDVDVTNSASEGDLLNYSIPANTLGTNNIIKITLVGTYEANSGTPTVVVRVRLGATIMYADTSGTLSATANKGGWMAVLHLAADGLTNDQDLAGLFMYGARAAVTSGFGDIGAGGGVIQIIGGDAAEDSTTALTLRVTVQWSAAQSSYHWRVTSGTLELVKS